MTRTWLVVDDEIADTFILRRAIKDSGLAVQILFFESALALIDHLDGPDCGAFELVLVDINMPETDGFELLERLKARSVATAVPLVMYSNTKDERDSLKASQRGASGFISKPSSFFEAKAIVRLLDDMVGH